MNDRLKRVLTGRDAYKTLQDSPAPLQQQYRQPSSKSKVIICEELSDHTLIKVLLVSF